VPRTPAVLPCFLSCSPGDTHRRTSPAFTIEPRPACRSPHTDRLRQAASYACHGQFGISRVPQLPVLLALPFRYCVYQVLRYFWYCGYRWYCWYFGVAVLRVAVLLALRLFPASCHRAGLRQPTRPTRLTAYLGHPLEPRPLIGSNAPGRPALAARVVRHLPRRSLVLHCPTLATEAVCSIRPLAASVLGQLREPRDTARLPHA